MRNIDSDNTVQRNNPVYMSVPVGGGTAIVAKAEAGFGMPASREVNTTRYVHQDFNWNFRSKHSRR
jgi:hypothetical protein